MTTHFASCSFTVASASGITKVYPAIRRYCFSRADLFNVWTTFRSERVRASGNSGPLATISTTNPSGAWPFRLSTDVPGADGPLGDEELVDGPSENELLDELSEEELDEAPPRRLDAWGRLGLCHSSNQKISHIISYSDLPGIHHLHLWAEDTRGRGILAAGSRGSARFKKGHRIGNLFGFPIFILSGDAGHHPAIDKGGNYGCEPSTWGPANPLKIQGSSKGRYKIRFEIKLRLLLVTRWGRGAVPSRALSLAVQGTTDFHFICRLLELRFPQYVIETPHPNLESRPPQTY
ncbi:hypothetical protein Cgig2_018873 [Carnegiea gigantea]|uniref:Uncharacterized protein n=1 Tax=Carnegiea gigantea TaxID=171969 RepID=A0A9Q1K9U2_9CARY|nr:hypothetical protein Cgig2_018873 [Carnegiea gigantea]